MIIRILKHEIRRGMYVELVECENKYFPRRRFVIESDQTMQEILKSPAEHVLVNSEKSKVKVALLGGPQTSASPPPLASLAREQEIETQLSQADEALKSAVSNIGAGSIDIAQLSEVSDDLRLAVEAAPDVFFKLTRIKSLDEGTYRHSISVSGFMMGVGRKFDLAAEDVRQLGIAGLLHDLGKLLIPQEILNKNGPLTDEERRVVQRHPEMGYRMLSRLDGVSKMALDITRFHHERLDGTGYPLGLIGDKISLPIRISAVCDVFDALTSIRPYKRAWARADALRWLFERDHQYDCKVVVRLANVLG